MATVNERKHKEIEAKVRKAIVRYLSQRGSTSSELRVVVKKSVSELKLEHDYQVMSWIGRSLTRLIKEGTARIGFDDSNMLKFFSCS